MQSKTKGKGPGPPKKEIAKGICVFGGCLAGAQQWVREVRAGTLTPLQIFTSVNYPTPSSVLDLFLSSN